MTPRAARLGAVLLVVCGPAVAREPAATGFEHCRVLADVTGALVLRCGDALLSVHDVPQGADRDQALRAAATGTAAAYVGHVQPPRARTVALADGRRLDGFGVTTADGELDVVGTDTVVAMCGGPERRRAAVDRQCPALLVRALDAGRAGVRRALALGPDKPMAPPAAARRIVLPKECHWAPTPAAGSVAAGCDNGQAAFVVTHVAAKLDAAGAALLRDGLLVGSLTPWKKIGLDTADLGTSPCRVGASETTCRHGRARSKDGREGHVYVGTGVADGEDVVVSCTFMGGPTAVPPACVPLLSVTPPTAP